MQLLDHNEFDFDVGVLSKYSHLFHDVDDVEVLEFVALDDYSCHLLDLILNVVGDAHWNVTKKRFLFKNSYNLSKINFLTC